MVQQAAIGLIGWKFVVQLTQQQFRGVADVYLLVSKEFPRACTDRPFDPCITQPYE
jgi:hypothetical protein